MNADRDRPERARARARRRAAGLVAQYIHELSERHAAVAEPPARPREALK